jgi:hypothetical protein
MNNRERQEQLYAQKQVNSKPDPRVITPAPRTTRSSTMIKSEVLPGTEIIPVSYNDLADLPTTFPPSVHNNASTTEIDFGTTPIIEKSFTITDANITSLSNVIVQIAYVVPTGKELDELEFDTFDFRCVSSSGSFILYARSLEGYVADKFKINYIY